MWAQILNTLLGLWLMAAPDVLGYRGAAGVNDHILGPIAASAACVALWEVTRAVRWVNLPIGLWLIAAPWVLGYGAAPRLNSLAVGLPLVAFAAVRGELRQRFGGGWSALWGKPCSGMRVESVEHGQEE